jgi:hypothetical protein
MIGVEHDLQLKDIINAPYQAFTAPQQVGRRRYPTGSTSEEAAGNFG